MTRYRKSKGYSDRRTVPRFLTRPPKTLRRHASSSAFSFGRLLSRNLSHNRRIWHPDNFGDDIPLWYIEIPRKRENCSPKAMNSEGIEGLGCLFDDWRLTCILWATSVLYISMTSIISETARRQLAAEEQEISLPPGPHHCSSLLSLGSSQTGSSLVLPAFGFTSSSSAQLRP